MLQVVEDLDVNVVARTIEGEQLTQTVVVIIFVCELEDGLARLLTEPYHGRACELVGPLAVGNKPWAHNACELGCCCEVNDHGGIVVGL